MKMQGFLLRISMIILSKPLTYCAMSAETVNKKTSTFTVKSGENIMSSCNTTDVYSKSESACGARCVLHGACCVASFSKESSICRLDITENCCVATNTAIGWSVMTRNQHTTCAGCISFGNSMYSIIGDLTELEKAKVNCKCIGGKLVEMETSEENEFIKNEVTTLNTGVQGYWIGGYNFNNDNDLEWISKPYQVMSYSDMYRSQPDNPMTELCMMIWRNFDFRWDDHSCNSQLSYICEF